ncbi:MAG: zinc ribbon domain-containing protein [Asgard group archaeon]|nr:zinc ribbon domain-containing protein [Asgard group archaeon]
MYTQEKNQKGIFVINNQVYSINDIISAMQRQGINVTIHSSGLMIEGERIPAISDFRGSNCPIAKTCEKRKALLQFLKLQKTQGRNSEFYSRETSAESYDYSGSPTRSYGQREGEHHARTTHRTREQRDFIKPNNHDLFEGNITDDPDFSNDFENTHYEEDQEEDFELFDDDLFSESSQEDFEKPLFDEGYAQETYHEKANSRRRQRMDYEDDYPSDEKPFCPTCGYDLDSSWSICPNCGEKIVRKEKKQDKGLFF